MFLMESNFFRYYNALCQFVEQKLNLGLSLYSKLQLSQWMVTLYIQGLCCIDTNSLDASVRIK